MNKEQLYYLSSDLIRKICLGIHFMSYPDVVIVR